MAADAGVPFVDLRAQYHALRDEARAAIDAVLEKGDFILGGAVETFERSFAAYCEVAHAVGLDSGLSALELALRALDVGPGDEVITAANSFVASALPISTVGATPILVDVDERSYNLDVALVEAAITPRTRAIMPVHLYGQPADMDPLLALAAHHGLAVVEDACQAHGARYHGRRVGGLGHVAAFSFYPAKNLGAYGDAGALVTNDPAIAERARTYRNYGSSRKYHHETRGSNRRLDTLQAAVLNVKLARLDDWNEGRRRAAAQYDGLLADANVVVPARASGVDHVYHLYVVRTADRDGLQAHLTREGIGTGIHYPVPIHLQPAYRDLPYRPGDFPITERLAGEILSLPMYAELSAAQVERVADAIQRHTGRAPGATQVAGVVGGA
jgi:dTDP-4-amino-4,6-dideoxygalactose transaminase